MSQSTQTPGWGMPPAQHPPKAKRQFLVTKIAIGVAAGIALFIVGAIVLAAVLISGGTSGKQATPTPTALPASAFPGSDTTPNQFTPDSAPTAQAPEVGKAGDTFTATASDGSAADLTITKITTATSDLEQFGQSVPSRGHYVIAHVKITVTNGSFDINPLDFYAKSSNGYHVEDPEYLDSWGPALDSGTLHDGEHISGTIVYDVPTKHGEIAYSPNLDSEPIATWSY